MIVCCKEVVSTKDSVIGKVRFERKGPTPHQQSEVDLLVTGCMVLLVGHLALTTA
jgi:hypothetical protein